MDDFTDFDKQNELSVFIAKLEDYLTSKNKDASVITEQMDIVLTCFKKNKQELDLLRKELELKADMFFDYNFGIGDKK